MKTKMKTKLVVLEHLEAERINIRVRYLKNLDTKA